MAGIYCMGRWEVSDFLGRSEPDKEVLASIEIFASGDPANASHLVVRPLRATPLLCHLLIAVRRITNTSAPPGSLAVRISGLVPAAGLRIARLCPPGNYIIYDTDYTRLIHRSLAEAVVVYTVAGSSVSFHNNFTNSNIFILVIMYSI